jgi:predicted HAD superfamily hydrolase
MANCAPLGGEVALQLSTHDLVSLDVFDTLILRAVSAPTDVFSLVKLALIARRETLIDPETLDAFPTLRVKAEQSARLSKQQEQGTPEVTLDEIYDRLGRLSGANPQWLAVMKETELDLEMRLAYPNPAGRCIWEAALAEHKKVVFCSDMYLPSSFISRLLEKCGYDRYDGLYVSCEHAKSKHDGTFFEYIAGLHGAPMERVLHIGDNQYSDCTMARQAGCSAIHLPQPASPATMSAAGGERPFYRNAAFSTIQGVLRKRTLMPASSHMDPWERVGYKVFGPLFTGFLLWLATVAQRNRPEKILLFARDTHFVKRHLQRFLGPVGVDADIEYIYVSRGSLLLPSFTDFQPTRLWHLFSGKLHKTVADHLRRLGLAPEMFRNAAQAAGFESIDEVVRNGEPRMHTLLTRLYEPLLVESARRRPLPKRYIERFVGGARRLMLVDIGWVGNMQSSFLRLLEPFTGDLQVRGHYVGLFGSARENDYPGQTMEGWLIHYGDLAELERKVWWAGGVELLEFAMCAPHGTTLGYALTEGGEVQPILESTETDAESYALSARVQKGAEQFLEEYLAIHGGIPAVALASRVWANEFYRLVTEPTLEEAELLGDLTHSDSAGDTRGRLAIAPRLPADNPAEVSEALERSYWKAGFMVRNGLAGQPA